MISLIFIFRSRNFLSCALFLIFGLLHNYSFSKEIPKISQIDKKSAWICESKGCEVAWFPKNLPEIQQLIPGRFVAPARFSFLAYTRAGLALCAASKWDGKTRCEMTSFPYMPGAQIMYIETETSQENQIAYTLGLIVAQSSQSDPVIAQKYSPIAKLLGQKVRIARDALRNRLSATRPMSMSASRIAIEQDEESEEVIPMEPIIIIGSSGSGGPSGSLNLFPISFVNPYDGEVMGEFATADGPCQKACLVVKDLMDKDCRIGRSPRAKALCWGANMAVYGVCLAGCP